MSFRDDIVQWLAELGDAIGSPLSLDPAGAAGLAFANGITVTLEVEDEVLHLHSALRRLPAASGRLEVLEFALRLNLLTRDTEGATLGLDPAADTLVLSVLRDAGSLSRGDFAGLLGAFAETAAAVRGRLLDGGGLPAAATAPSPAGLDGLIDPRMRA